MQLEKHVLFCQSFKRPVLYAGGYYLSMAASKIVAEQLTITGSIGVITGKFNLEQLYGKIGYAKELISKGRSVVISLAVLILRSPTSNKIRRRVHATCSHTARVLSNTTVKNPGLRQLHIQYIEHCSAWERVFLQLTQKCGPSNLLLCAVGMQSCWQTTENLQRRKMNTSQSRRSMHMRASGTRLRSHGACSLSTCSNMRRSPQPASPLVSL